MKQLLAFLFFSFHLYSLSAQWTATSVPGSDAIRQVLIVDNTTFLCSGTSGIYHSANSGKVWDLVVQSDVVFNNDDDYHLTVSSDGQVFALGEATTLLKSTNKGRTWTIASPFQNIDQLKAIKANSDFVLAAGIQDLFRYDRANPSAAPELILHTSNISLGYGISIAEDNNVFWVNNNDTLLTSSNSGTTWEVVHIFSNTIKNIAVHNNTLLISTSDGLSRSLDGGITWTLIQPQSTGHRTIWNGNQWITFTYTGSVFDASNDNGITWQNISSIPAHYGGISNIDSKDNILLFCNWGNIFKSVDNGQTWEKANAGLTGGSIPSTEINLQKQGNLLVKADYYSANPDSSWIRPVFDNNNQVHWSESVYHNGHYFIVDNYNGYIYRNTSDLYHWEVLPEPPSPTIAKRHLISANEKLFRIDYNITGVGHTIFLSTDNGSSWASTGGLPGAYSFDATYFGYKGRLYRHRSVIPFQYTEDGTNWINAATNLDALLPNGIGLINFVCTENRIIAYNSSGLAWSDDDGVTFFPYTHPLPGAGISDAVQRKPVVAEGEYLVVLDNLYQVHYTYGTNNVWTTITDNLNDQNNNPVGNIALLDGQLFAWTQVNKLYKRALADLNLVQLSGMVYQDNNNNGQKDPTESPLEGIVVNAGSDGFATTNADGTYIIHTELTNDTLRVHKKTPWWVTTPNYYLVNQTESNRDFGIYLPQNVTDFAIDQTQYGIFRPGFDSYLRITANNHGMTETASTIRFVPHAPLQYLSANHQPDAISGDTLIWNTPIMAPLTGAYVVDITLYLPPDVLINTGVSSWASITTAATDIYSADNTHHFSDLVVGSFDPNDKRVTPHNGITPEQVAAGEWLTYTIRFQNTGNYPADFVRIADTLEVDYLDLSTFEVLATSHPYQLTLKDRGVVSFLFDPINLPPASWDELGSHGFAKYRIKPKKSLLLGDQVRNTAFIYFDYNPAIITNTTQTEVYLPVSTQQRPDMQNLLLTPNPTTGKISILLPEFAEGPILIYSSNGTLISRQNISGNMVDVDLSIYANGFYQIVLQAKNGITYTGVAEKISPK